MLWSLPPDGKCSEVCMCESVCGRGAWKTGRGNWKRCLGSGRGAWELEEVFVVLEEVLVVLEEVLATLEPDTLSLQVFRYMWAVRAGIVPGCPPLPAEARASICISIVFCRAAGPRRIGAQV